MTTTQTATPRQQNTTSHSPATDAPASRIEVLGRPLARSEEVLSPEALAFVTELHDRFASSRHERLAERQRRRYEIGNGRDPKFRDDTRHIREDRDWRVAGAGPGLEDRRVEITGPAEPAMALDALNSGARVWLADLEDATSPTWHNIIEAQITLFDAVRGQLTVSGPDGQERTITAENPPTITMRPRGWHLVEKHLRYVNQQGSAGAASASLVDFGLYAFHNATELIARGRGPYFYIAKIESSEEAKLWDDIFTFTEEYLGLAHGTIRATVHIETLPAAFEMEEILYVMRDHVAGLNAGRWDYIFSIIKNYRGRGARFVLPDRSDVTMSVPFMRAYSELLLKTCHARGAHAIGGMSAFIPQPASADRAQQIEERIRADKEREAADGFDGTWVAHPALVATAAAAFDAVLGAAPNQLDRRRDDVSVSAADLLDVRIGRDVTEAGVRENVSITVRYLEAWLRGDGAVALDGLVEDASTAEISRSQIWQWIHQDQRTVEGTAVTREWVEGILQEMIANATRSESDRFDDAAALFRDIALGEQFPTFLTVPAYSRYLVEV